MSIHVALRPEWLCSGCPDPWPCVTRRQELVAEFLRSPEALTLTLTGCLIAASRELSQVPAGVLRARFLGWAPGSAAASEALTVAAASQLLSQMREQGDLPAGALYARFVAPLRGGVYLTLGGRR